VTEGNSGTTMANFNVQLDKPATGDVSFWYYTYDVTAGAYSDYEPPFAQFVIPAGQTSATLSIPIYGDTQVEADEVFELYMYGASANAIIDNNSAFCTIVNDDTPQVPSISIANASITEGNSSWKNLRFTLTRSGDLSQSSSVIATTDATGYLATEGVDYRRQVSMFTFYPGESTKFFNVRIFGDTTLEPDETFAVKLSAANNATLAVDLAIGTIINDDSGTMQAFGQAGSKNYFVPPDVFGNDCDEPIVSSGNLRGSKKLRTII